MNSTCVHVVQYTSLCTSSTLHTLFIFSRKFNFSIPVFPDFTMPRAARNRRRVSNTVNLASMVHGAVRGFNRSRQPANFAAYFPNHRRLLSNIKFLLSPLSFLSHTISHLLNMKYGIKRKRFLCYVHFSGRCISTFLKGHGINDFNTRRFSCIVSHVD